MSIENDLQKRLEAANSVILQQQEEIKQLSIENALVLAEKRQWEQAKALQEQIISIELNKANTQYQQAAEEIQRLKERLRKYEGD